MVTAAVAALAAAVVAGGAQPIHYDVTFTATQSSTWTCQVTGAPNGTLTATLRSTQPVRATVGGGTIRFAPRAELPFEATVAVSIAGCGPSPARTCGPVTAAIRPGGFVSWTTGRLKFAYDSNTRLFPDEDSCSSGLLEMLATAGLDVSALRGNALTVTGGGTRDDALSHTQMTFRARFVPSR